MKKLSLLLFMFFGVVGMTIAQRTVTGIITDASGESLIGASVLAKGSTSDGTITDIDGSFSLSVPDGINTLVVSYTGYETQEVDITGISNVSVNLAEGQLLDEIVITGVGKGTSTKKLGFAVSKVGGEILEKVPGLDPGNALRGKAAGVRIVQPSGNPSYGSEIRLRGSTSISGSQQPLIIIDGIITSGSLRDINMDDVESMEVVKGAAASALYGSLAGNGVIQIITKTGNSAGTGSRVTIKNEYGSSSLARKYPVATKHPYLLDAEGVRDGDWNGDGVETSNFGFDLTTKPTNDTPDPDGLFDNDYPTGAFDHVDRFLSGGAFYNNNISLATTGEKANYLLSFSNQVADGLVDVLPSYKRRNFRANIDVRPTDKLKVSFRGSYGITDGTEVDNNGGQGNNLFFNLLTYEPFIDLSEEDPNGEFEYNPSPSGFEASSTNSQNPLYVGDALKWGFNRDRLLGGLSVTYDLFKDFAVEGAYTLDKTTEDGFFQEPVGFFNPSSFTESVGSQFNNFSKETKTVTSLQGQYTPTFGDLKTTFTLKYLLEDLTGSSFNAGGTEFVAAGINNLGGLVNPTIGSFEFQEIAENVFLDAQFDWKDKVIIGAMVRNDGSSSFGENERRQTFFRGSAAYRISEDFSINGIDEWKVRASYGTSGQRPIFSAQYETFAVSNTGTSRNILGNKDLKSSVVKEIEVGTNVAFGNNRYTFEANYAKTNTENDYILVPLSSVAGFSAQWQNVGNIESSAIELGLTANLIDKKDFSWDASLFWDKINQEITDLSGIPNFTRDTDSALDIFRVEEGLPYGTMYGNLVITDIDQLTTNSEGHVLNAIGTNPLADDRPLTKDDFYINSDGYVVAKTLDEDGNVVESTGTAAEQAIYLADEEGNKISTAIGNTNPDWNLGLSTTVNFKGISLYVLVDHQQGGDIYNYTRQLLYFNDRHGDLQDYGAEGKHVAYSNGASNLYNLASSSSHFVESGTFTKVREVSLGYNFNKSRLGPLAKYLSGMKVAITGRNLFTFTDYSGFDPEVALNNNPTNFRFDEYSYPNYRTFTGSVTLEF